MFFLKKNRSLMPLSKTALRRTSPWKIFPLQTPPQNNFLPVLMRNQLFKVAFPAINHWFGVAAAETGGEFSVIYFLLLFFWIGYIESPIIFCVCVKRIPLCDCLCSSSSRFSASRCWNIGAGHIWDFDLCCNVKSHVCCYTTSSPVRKRIRSFQRTTQSSGQSCT